MPNRLTGKPQLNRFVNRRLILDKIRREGEISRADLAKQTAIRPPTVSAVIKELIEEGLVEEIGAGETSGGRAPRMLALSRNHLRALGFDMSDTAIIAGLCDLNGDLCVEREIPYAPLPPLDALDQLHELGADVLKQAGLDWSGLQGIGIALPGHLNAQTGHVRWSKPFNWHDVPFKDLCEARWGVTTDVINDSLAGGMASHHFAADDSLNNLVFLYLRFQEPAHLEMGIGAGIIINGSPYHGQFGAAGEVTTLVDHPFVHIAKSGAPPYASVAAFTDAVLAGDAVAVAALAAVSQELASLVIHIVNLLEPGALVIGSDVPALRDVMLPSFQQSLDAHNLPHQIGRTRIVASTLGQFGVARGAVVPTLQRLFRIPQWS
jgi:N-acetylglucosamine repressor